MQLKDKKCWDCEETKDVSLFSKHAAKPDGLSYFCKSCSKKNKLRIRYGMSLEEYNQLHLNQNGVCAICRKEETRPGKTLAVDHDHKTGKVRGLLCSKCNQAIGLLKDDPENVEALLCYLMDHYHLGR